MVLTKILLVDDDENIFFLVDDFLSDFKDRSYEIEWANTFDQGLNIMSKNCHDVYLVDYELGEFNGLDLLKEVQKKGCSGPKIMITGQGGLDIDQQAMQFGAVTYINKDELNPQLLERSIRYALHHQDKEKKLSTLAQSDALTRLHNRSGFQEIFESFLESENQNQTQQLSALMYIDLDYFKQINDNMGHDIGDLVLKTVADRMLRAIRSCDVAARVGGDEFIVLLQHVDDAQEVGYIAKRIIEKISQPIKLNEQLANVGASIGIAFYPEHGVNSDALCKHADTAMYYSKNSGKNRFTVYHPEMQKKIVQRDTLKQQLNKALDNDEFILHYQPRIDANTQKILGLEALLRWQQPESNTIVKAGDFIPLTEETGLIVPIGEWVLRQACEQSKKWHNNGYSDIPISVNLSLKQLQTKDFEHKLHEIIDDYELDTHSLALELPENLLMENPHNSETLLEKLRQTGFKIILDDFGTGYSSLARLKQMPIDGLKLDHSLINGMHSTEEELGIIIAIINFAHCLHLRVIAEGVETDEQLKSLQQHHIDEIQGYIATPPVTAKQIERWLIDKKINYKN